MDPLPEYPLLTCANRTVVRKRGSACHVILGDGILSFMPGPSGSDMEQKLESLILAQNERWRHA